MEGGRRLSARRSSCSSLPLIVVIAIGVKLSSRGPVIYPQERVTWNGRRFAMFKFRTMPVGAEATTGPVCRPRRDARDALRCVAAPLQSRRAAAAVQRAARRDVARGPRPERPEFVAKFRDRIEVRTKHLVKAGITGWAQVNDLRGDSDIALRIQYDLYYVEHWSPWFDLRILALTFGTSTTRNAH